jgi:hypothetical protein
MGKHIGSEAYHCRRWLGSSGSLLAPGAAEESTSRTVPSMESAVSPIAMFYDDHNSGSQCSQARPDQGSSAWSACSASHSGYRDGTPRSSLKEIADILGHRSLVSTGVYAKLDLGSLSKVAMPWPGGAHLEARPSFCEWSATSDYGERWDM